MTNEGLRYALAASIASRLWVALIGIVAVPLYVRVLGIESYGLVGVFTSLQVFISFLDLGLGAALIREVGRLSASEGSRQKVQDVAWTCELTYISIAVVIGVGLAFAGGAVVDHWLQLKQLRPEEARQAMLYAAIAIALQWPNGIYSTGLAAMQRQVLLATVSAVASLLRTAFVLVGIVAWDPSIETFFAANAIGAAVQTLVARIIFWRVLGTRDRRPRWDVGFFKGIYSFAGTMTLVAITSTILMQVDKVVLSKALSLDHFGIYTLTSTLAAGLYVFISPVFSVVYPRFSGLVAQGDEAAVRDLFHLATQFLAVLLSPVALVFAFFSYDVMYLWTGNAAISSEARWPVALLIAGNTVNGFMNVPYAVQLAFGWPRLMLMASIAAVLLLTPAAYFLALRFGPVGGAAAWLGVNVIVLLATQWAMHRRLLRGEARRWWGNVIRALLAALAVVALCRMMLGAGHEESRLRVAVELAVVWGLATLLTIGALPKVRARLVQILKSPKSTFSH